MALEIAELKEKVEGSLKPKVAIPLNEVIQFEYTGSYGIRMKGPEQLIEKFVSLMNAVDMSKKFPDVSFSGDFLSDLKQISGIRKGRLLYINIVRYITLILSDNKLDEKKWFSEKFYSDFGEYGASDKDYYNICYQKEGGPYIVYTLFVRYFPDFRIFYSAAEREKYVEEKSIRVGNNPEDHYAIDGKKFLLFEPVKK